MVRTITVRPIAVTVIGRRSAVVPSSEGLSSAAAAMPLSVGPPLLVGPEALRAAVAARRRRGFARMGAGGAASRGVVAGMAVAVTVAVAVMAAIAEQRAAPRLNVRLGLAGRATGAHFFSSPNQASPPLASCENGEPVERSL